MIRKAGGFLFILSLPLFASPEASPEGMSYLEAVILGLVEGLTRYLPVSSTGHLILASQAMGMGEDDYFRASVKTYLVVIQIGAILAVVTVYGEYILRMIRGVFNRDDGGRRLLVSLITAFIPAAVAGLLLDEWISEILYGLWFVVTAWFVGGAALLMWKGNDTTDTEEVMTDMENLTMKQAFLIGSLQVIAMWPGVSRSLVTILGGKLVGLSLKHSVIFSFLLGMITLSAATAYKLVTSGTVMLETLGLSTILLGIVVAYVSAWVAVKTMVTYLKNHGLGLFGIYRIGLAILTAGLLYLNILSP